MILVSSAILAIVLQEPGWNRFIDVIVANSERRMSVANWFEATMVVDRRGDPLAIARLEDFFREADIELLPVTHSQAILARVAWNRYGRGVHPAKLNYGDCFAYALAREAREPLLFKGADFAQTDIEPALRD